jgi:hypothetical protein
MKKWFAIPALAGAVAIGGVAMVANADKGVNPSTGVLAVEAGQAKLTVEEVEAKAVESVDGTVTEIDYDSSDNEYEVEVEVDLLRTNWISMQRQVKLLKKRRMAKNYPL